MLFPRASVSMLVLIQKKCCKQMLISRMSLISSVCPRFSLRFAEVRYAICAAEVTHSFDRHFPELRTSQHLLTRNHLQYFLASHTTENQCATGSADKPVHGLSQTGSFFDDRMQVWHGWRSFAAYVATIYKARR